MGSTIVTDLFESDDFFHPKSLINSSSPSVNVKENPDSFEIELAVPGFKKSDFNVKVNNGVLNISSEKEKSIEETDENYTRKEFSYSSFGRSFTLPDSINSEEIKAKYKDGILRILLAKKEASKKIESKTISID